jgi:2-desacetyl-2-hydroxyethyl bacteriochlorophyllide A dehydrogenase
MRAALFPSPGLCEIVERGVPSPAAGEILVQVHACGVCGTDLHIYQGDFPARFPLVAGHEFAGLVQETGPGVVHLRAGDRVTVDPNISCGACPPCQKGYPHLCRDLSAVGVTLDGGFATHCAVPARQAHQFPQDMPFAIAAMSEPVACCVHGIEQARLRPGDTVLIIGAGMIGLVMLQLALLHGASAVLVSEPSPQKRQTAHALGATAVVNPDSDDLAQAVAQALGGDRTGDPGADLVIECVGTESTAQQAISLAAEAGRVLFFGVSPEAARVTLSPYQVYRKELTITGSFTNPFTQGRALALLHSGRLKVEELITHRLPLDQLPKALDLIAAHQATKILIQPQL